MKKTTLLKTMLLLCALIVGGSSAWADTETFDYADYKGKGTQSSGSDYTMVKTDVSIKDTKFFGNNSQAHFYANGVITVTPAENVTITKIEITATEEDYNGYQSKGSITASTGSISPDGTTVTWTGIATSAFTLSHNKQIRWTSIEVTYTKSAAYTITAVSNNVDWGTVEGTTTITAKPKTGYRVKAGKDGYTVTSGEATVTNNGDNTFSVTPSSDCTVQINFEAIPTRTITINSTADGTITVKNGKTSVASGSSVYEGTELTIEAEAGVNKEFASWSVDGATPASMTEASTTLTVGEKNITIAATFNGIITHAISWSVNGVIIDTENIKHGDAIDFAAPASGVPAGYAFKGWVVEANKINTPTDLDPSANYVTEATSTADITYYAVLAIEKADKAEKLFNITNEELTGCITNKYGEGTFNKTFEGETYKILVYGSKQAGMCQLKDQSSPVPCIYVPELPGNITNIATTACSDASGNTYTGTIHIKSARTRGNADTNDITKVELSGASSFSINITTECNYFYLVTSAGLRVQDLKVTFEGLNYTYSGYCTTIPTFAVTVNSKAEYATFSDATDRDFSGSGITVYTAKATDSSVQLTEVTDGIVPANTGVVLYAAGGATKNIPAVYTTKTTLDDNEMVANVTEANVAQDGGEGKTNYILAKESGVVGFYLATVGGAKLHANRAYLSTTATGNGEAREFLGFGDGETTAIDGVKAASVENGAVYNLAGQRVAQPTKGLYIVNGKKYIVK